MKQSLTILFTFAFLLITAHRLPAPITEVPESPTPTPIPLPASIQTPKAVQQESAEPKAKIAKAKAKSKAPSETAAHAKSSASSSQAPEKFAGVWTGTITQPMGLLKVSFVCNETGTVVTMAAGPRPATVNGSTVSWRSGMINGNEWTLTPNNDGKTAQVTIRWPIGNGAATFYRDHSSEVVANATTPTSQQTEPTAKPVPDKPGFVYNPFDSNSKTLLDVRGKTSGSKVKDPFSGKLFIVP